MTDGFSLAHGSSSIKAPRTQRRNLNRNVVYARGVVPAPTRRHKATAVTLHDRHVDVNPAYLLVFELQEIKNGIEYRKS